MRKTSIVARALLAASALAAPVFSAPVARCLLALISRLGCVPGEPPVILEFITTATAKQNLAEEENMKGKEMCTKCWNACADIFNALAHTLARTLDAQARIRQREHRLMRTQT